MKKRLLTLLLAGLMLCLCLPSLAEETAKCPYARQVSDLFVSQVPECDPVDDTFFENSLLIGDSIASALEIREVLPSSLHIEYVIGLSPSKARTSKKVAYGDERVTMVELCQRMQPKNLFVMLGSNGLDRMKSGDIADDYHELLDELLQVLPDTEIYLLTVTPIRSPATKKEYPTFTHARIQDFNKRLIAMAEEHGVRVIDCYTPLMMENMRDGEKTNFTGDGIHLTQQGAEKVAQTIRTHVKPDIIYETETIE